jgi:hypothetical protein
MCKAVGKISYRPADLRRQSSQKSRYEAMPRHKGKTTAPDNLHPRTEKLYVKARRADQDHLATLQWVSAAAEWFEVGSKGSVVRAALLARRRA